MRVIWAQLGPVTLHDVRQLSGQAIYDPDDYRKAQQLGYALRDAKSYGVHYQSVRAEYGVDTKFFERNNRLPPQLLDERFDGAVTEQGLVTFLDALEESDH